jgi:hypothetical protein
MSQNVLNTYDELRWTFEEHGEWKLTMYEDYAMFTDFYEQVTEIMFRIDWE